MSDAISDRVLKLELDAEHALQDWRKELDGLTYRVEQIEAERREERRWVFGAVFGLLIWLATQLYQHLPSLLRGAGK